MKINGTLSQQEIRALAVEGARVKLDILTRDAERLAREFPELTTTPGTAIGFSVAVEPRVGETSAQATRRHTRELSTEARQAISKRMKKYWRGQRAKKADAAGVTA